jgi:hypothetical protein
MYIQNSSSDSLTGMMKMISACNSFVNIPERKPEYVSGLSHDDRQEEVVVDLALTILMMPVVKMLIFLQVLGR